MDHILTHPGLVRAREPRPSQFRATRQHFLLVPLDLFLLALNELVSVQARFSELVLDFQTEFSSCSFPSVPTTAARALILHGGVVGAHLAHGLAVLLTDIPETITRAIIKVTCRLVLSFTPFWPCRVSSATSPSVPSSVDHNYTTMLGCDLCEDLFSSLWFDLLLTLPMERLSSEWPIHHA